MRRDLDIDCDPAGLVLEPPDRSQLKEIFRHFEFRNLLGRVDELDTALPAAPMAVTGVEVPWHEGPIEVRSRVGFAAEGDRAAVATADGVVVGPRPARSPASRRPRREGAGVDAADDALAAHRSSPGRATSTPRARGRVRRRALPSPETDEETAALVRAAELPRRLVDLLARPRTVNSRASTARWSRRSRGALARWSAPA
jgi:hypothetical protein